jgi:hypothetical protein
VPSSTRRSTYPKRSRSGIYDPLVTYRTATEPLSIVSASPWRPSENSPCHSPRSPHLDGALRKALPASLRALRDSVVPLSLSGCYIR